MITSFALIYLVVSIWPSLRIRIQQLWFLVILNISSPETFVLHSSLKGSLLSLFGDQAYSTMSQYYDEALILPPVGLSEQSSILLQPSNYHAPSLPATRVLKRNCKAPNRQALLSFLQAVNWTPLYHMSLFEDQFNDFQSTLATAMDKC